MLTRSVTDVAVDKPPPLTVVAAAAAAAAAVVALEMSDGASCLSALLAVAVKEFISSRIATIESHNPWLTRKSFN